MPGFQKEYEIYYFQINQKQEATPVSILQYLEDAAIAHSEAVGLGIEQLLAQRTGWILNHWLLKMEQYPRQGEKIRIETWASDFERFYGRRKFRISDSQGRYLGQADSLWVFLNLDRRRPIRIPEHFVTAYSLIRSEKEEGFQELPNLTDVQAEMKFRVRQSDIDTNGHVNNTRYVDWMLEGIHEDFLQNHKITELEVIYKKETRYGVAIASETQRHDTSQEPQFLHRILDETGGQELALGRTRWQAR